MRKFISRTRIVSLKAELNKRFLLKFSILSPYLRTWMLSAKCYKILYKIFTINLSDLTFEIIVLDNRK